MSHLLSDRLSTCPKCGNISDDSQTIDGVIVIHCHECDHIWAALNMNNSDVIPKRSVETNINIGSTKPVSDLYGDGDMWIQKQ